MNGFGSTLAAISATVVGLAAIAVIFGSKNTSGVISSAGTAYSGIIDAAVSPAVQSG